MNGVGYLASDNPVISIRKGNISPLAYFRVTQGSFFVLEGVSEAEVAEGMKRSLRGVDVVVERLAEGARTPEDAFAFLMQKGDRKEDIRVFVV